MSRPRAMLLDVGNTLLGWDLGRVVAALAAAGVRTDAEALARAEAAGRPALDRELAGGRSTEAAETSARRLAVTLEALGLGAGEAAPAAAAAAEALRPGAPLFSRVLPGVPAALRRLRAAGVRLVVVSNSDGSVADLLAGAGLLGLLDDVVDSGTVGVEKPDPRIFRHGLAAAGCAPEEAVHVGDLYSVDVAGARAAGIRPVLLDPHGDWGPVDCERAPDLAAVAEGLLAGGPVTIDT